VRVPVKGWFPKGNLAFETGAKFALGGIPSNRPSHCTACEVACDGLSAAAEEMLSFIDS